MTADALWDGFAPPNVEAISPYEPGKPIEELERELGIVGAVKLASNENPLGPSPRGLAAAERALAQSSRYPDGGGHHLRTALAERHGVAPEDLILGAGSNDLIDLLVRTFCAPGRDEVVTHRAAFVMYRISCLAHGVTLHEAPITSDLACDVDALAAAITPRTKLVFLPNPNNPTGAYVPAHAFERLLDKIPPRVLFVVDEAYHEYAAHAHSDYPISQRYRSPRHPMVVTLRTFSKIYGLAALRVGYAIADPRVISYLNRVRLPFNVSTPAQEAARAALDDYDHVEHSRRVNEAGLVQLTRGLAPMMKVFPSAANFLLVDVGRDAGPIYDALLHKGVIVRPLRPSGLGQHLRVSIGTEEENTRAIRAFAEVLGKA